LTDLSLTSNGTGRDFFTAKLNFFSVRENPPSALQQLSSLSSRTGRNCWAGPNNLFTPRLPTSVIFPLKRKFGDPF
jgi:hypothetical protein